MHPSLTHFHVYPQPCSFPSKRRETEKNKTSHFTALLSHLSITCSFIVMALGAAACYTFGPDSFPCRCSLQGLWVWFLTSGSCYTIITGFSRKLLPDILVLPQVMEILGLWISAELTPSRTPAGHRWDRC